MNDRNIPDSTWQRHMQQYGDTYQLQRDEIGIWGIRCKHGTIQPYSIVKNQLVAVLDFPTKRTMTFFQRKLTNKARCEYLITQEGENDCCIMFNGCDIKKMQYLLKLRRKRQLSEETREKFRQNIKKVRDAR